MVVTYSAGGRAMRWIVFLLACTVPALAAQATGFNRPGQIAGSLTGEDGSAIAGAFVSLELLPPYPKRLPKTTWTSVTGGGGAFQFDQLIAGKYRLCAQVPGSTWLNPCQWGSKSPLFTVTPAQPVADASLVMKRGVAIPIRVEDSGQLVSKHEGKTPGALLTLGVSNDAYAFQVARLVSRDSSSQTLEIIIPFNSPRRIVVRSAYFQLADAAGAALSSARATVIPVAVLAGQKPVELRLKVTGAGRP
jgi:hypothetical protein